MLNVINIGNTNVQTAVYSGGIFYDFRVTPTKEFTAGLPDNGFPAAVASVVPELNRLFDENRTLFVSDGIKLGYSFAENVVSSTIGADRLANASALLDLGVPAVCIDAGTAVTFETLNSDGEFAGGAIMPGRSLMREALYSFTAQLPKVPISPVIPEMGKNTADAVAMGVDRGLIGAVKEICSELAAGADRRIVVTGGDADFILKYFPAAEPADKFFTLRGIVRIWELNR